jgi:predicted amidohydrolase
MVLCAQVDSPRKAVWYSILKNAWCCVRKRDCDRLQNCHVLIDDGGALRSWYRKLHLFDAPFVGLRESAFTQAGEALAGQLAFNLQLFLKGAHRVQPRPTAVCW